MEATDRTQYSASASLLGYIYQCRLALLETLKRLKNDPNIAVTIETLDDVVFERDGTPTEVIQVKHHISRKANLTNASTDLWKTMRIWVDLYKENLTKEGSIFCLMTTELAAQNSAAIHLRIENRDIAEAEKILLQTAQTSTNDTNKEAYTKFMELTPEDRGFLLKSVYILDNCPLSEDLQQHLEDALWSSCPRNQVKNFLQYLEGWWINEVVNGLKSSQSKPITGAEFDVRLNFLREQFKSDSLPIHPDVEVADPALEPFVEWMFSKQLNLIDVRSSRRNRAAKYFYMASEQRSRWVREDLLINSELEKYDDTLTEEWSILFDQIQDDIADSANEDKLISSGKKVFAWVEHDANIPIRKSCTDPFITRGSYQILANQLRVGWHPQFKDRLSSKSEDDQC
jgi:hypothetical protein